MGFRLAAKSMTLDDLELDGGWPPLFFRYINYQNSRSILHRDMMFGSRVVFSTGLSFEAKGLHMRTAVARLSLRQLGFLVYYALCYYCYIIFIFTCFIIVISKMLFSFSATQPQV